MKENEGVAYFTLPGIEGHLRVREIYGKLDVDVVDADRNVSRYLLTIDTQGVTLYPACSGLGFAVDHDDDNHLAVRRP